MTYVHSLECKLLPKEVQMQDLNLIEQDYILRCQHPTHNAVRLMFGYKEELVNRELVKK